MRERLVKYAIEARKNAYAPYSHFNVGAALLAKSGEIYTGCNIENSSYSASVCAERVALFKAVSEGEREFIALALVTDTKEPVMPCGICRQVLAEFAPKLKIYSATISGAIKEVTLDKIFPYAFTRKNLGG